MSLIPSSSFGIAEAVKIRNLITEFQVEAVTTALARQLMARSTIDGTSLRAVEFSVGEGGFDPFNYTRIVPVNPDATGLDLSVFTDTIDEYEQPNERCACHYCVLENGEANTILGEVGIWSIIMNSPVPGENGTMILSAIGHFPAKPKNSDMQMAIRVIQQM